MDVNEAWEQLMKADLTYCGELKNHTAMKAELARILAAARPSREAVPPDVLADASSVQWTDSESDPYFDAKAKRLADFVQGLAPPADTNTTQEVTNG